MVEKVIQPPTAAWITSIDGGIVQVAQIVRISTNTETGNAVLWLANHTSIESNDPEVVPLPQPAAQQ